MATATTSSVNPLETMSSPFDDMESTHPSPDFLKLEDLDNNTNDSGAELAATSPDAQTTPPPVIVTSKPAKKRKSWGQQLPEPKTTLPPRKRAKTDDEKEQRRIERIKRNRAAAHNSRERKRQETEVLAVENAQLRTKLEAFEKHFGPLPKHIVLPEVTLCTDDVDTPAPSLVDSRGSIATATSPASPPDLYDFTSNDIAIKQEPHDSPYSDYQHSFDNLDGKQHMPTFAPLDETQHSAVSVERALEGGALKQQLTSLPYATNPHPGNTHGAELQLPPHLQDPHAGDVDPFAFTTGASDFCFNAGLDFSFDDFLHTDGLQDAAISLGDGAGAA